MIGVSLKKNAMVMIKKSKEAVSKQGNSYFHFLQINFAFARFVYYSNQKVGIFMIETRQSKLDRIKNKYDFDGNAHQSSRVS